jgi:hypothetical protein
MMVNAIDHHTPFMARDVLGRIVKSMRKVIIGFISLSGGWSLGGSLANGGSLLPAI